MLLWSGLLSPFSAKVRIYLAERGIEHETRDIPWSREKLWGPKPEAFLQASPRGEVPALEDGELKLFDSTLICEYLEDAYAQSPLMPKEAAPRAVCRMWEDQADHCMARHLTVLIREGFLKPAGGGDRVALGAAVESLGGFYATMDQCLADYEYLCGAYSAADIACYVCLMFAQTLGAPFDQCTHVQQWFERVARRPAVQAQTAAIAAAAAAA